ncbi:MAG TPA: GntR family transcriptional regulator [Rugosimonospora sp.]|nr:GntR family transcriptional regulator [Rugosimonospora sp.]
MARLSGGEPVFRRVANDLKARIEQGEFRPGQQIPREDVLAAQYGVARGTVRRANRLLEYACILEVRHGYGTFVRTAVEPDVVELAPQQKVTARMPTLEEQQDLEIPETTPVLVVVDPETPGMAYPADRVVLICP